jgi:hypothetical protein
MGVGRRAVRASVRATAHHAGRGDAGRPLRARRDLGRAVPGAVGRVARISAAADYAPDDTVPNDTVPDDTVPDDTVPDDTVPNDTAPNNTAAIDTTVYDTTVYDTTVCAVRLRAATTDLLAWPSSVASEPTPTKRKPSSA